METQDFLRVISELDFILDDIDEIAGQLELTKSEKKQNISGHQQHRKIKKNSCRSISDY